VAQETGEDIVKEEVDLHKFNEIGTKGIKPIQVVSSPFL